MFAFIGPAISFLLSPVGRYVAIGLVFAAMLGGSFYKGHSIATAKCRAAAMQSRLDAMKTDLTAANEAAAAAEAARQELEQASADDKVRIAEYEKQLAARPAGACALTDDDLRMLDAKPDRK